MRHAARVDSPRRRAAGRPAGPPDPAPTAAPQDAGGSAATDGRNGDPADSTAPSPHRRRSRAPREAASARPDDGIRQDDPNPPGVQLTAAASTAVSTDRIELAPAQPSSSSAPAREERRRGEPRDDRRRGESAVERSLRALVSTRTTQLPFGVAMRAREVAQPSAQDLEDAERDLVIVRRHYVPPAPLVTKKGDAGKTSAGRPDEDARTGENRRSGRRSGRG